MTEPDHVRPALLADPAVVAILDVLPRARVVGGAVRDALAGSPVHDIDLATPLLPEAVVAALQDAGIRTIPTGLQHGTVTAMVGSRAFEITTLRRDVATDGRHAVVAFTDDWQQDAARRDFTINAMSMAADATVFDYFGGREDLAAGRVRFVGDAAARIAEDYLRILRFFRFYARYGRDGADAAAVEAIRHGVPGLGRLSAERVWSELGRILAAADPGVSLALMADTGVLAAIIPEGASPSRLRPLIRRGAPADPLLRLAALLDGDADVFADRLHLSAAERDRLTQLRSPPAPDPTMSDAALRRLLADAPAALLIGRAWLAQDAGPGWDALRARIAELPRPEFPLAGRDALALGMSPGPDVGGLLRAVRAWWLAGGCVADAAACRRELARRAGLAATGT